MITKMWDEILEQPAVLEKCMQNAGYVREIVGMLKSQDIHFVYIAARGTSDHAAVYGKYLIEYLLGIPVALAAASIFTIYHQTLNLKNSLVIGISQSGAAADVLEVIQSANDHGAVTVSITNAPESPLAKAAKFHLYCNAGIEESVAATKTFSSQIYLLAQLATEWAGQKKMQQQLAKVPEQVKAALELANDIPGKVERYLLMNECFILARGINYAVALEAALKIQETNYIRAKAFATSDFQHGPIAMIDRGIPAMVFAPEGPAFEDVTKTMSVLSQNQVELIVISNNEELLKQYPSGFAIPATNEDFISPFFNVVIAQMFACQLALVKKLDPDHPRRLKKITVTL
jgi:Glucosamine 6-phosphate synthetase, contains amidotransferase and phosphosugar isomerase domains